MDTHGFRFDAAAWLSQADGLAAARVRATITGSGSEADRALLDGEIAKVLEEQREDGTFGDHTGPTGNNLAKLLELGCDPDVPEVQRGLDALIRQHREGQRPQHEDDDPAHANMRAGVLVDAGIRALCLGGRPDVDEVKSSLRWLCSHPETWLGHPYGCPWGPNGFLQTLWVGRESWDVTRALELGLNWFNRSADAAGLVGHLDPWGTVQTVATIDMPEARDLALRLLPMLLRAQKPDGGWDGHSVEAFGALHRHGLLEELRDHPALPDDWTELKRIPAPRRGMRHLAWDGTSLWAHDPEANEAVGFSPADGSGTAHIPLPVEDVHGLAWIDGTLAACQGGPWKPVKNLFLLDRNGGTLATHSLDKVSMAIGVAEVDGHLWVGDGFDFEAKVLDLDAPQELQPVKWPGTCCSDLTGSADGVWHVDSFAPLMIECDRIGQMLDWAEIPFHGAVGGVTWDGERLWALDRRSDEVCAIDRTPP